MIEAFLLKARGAAGQWLAGGVGRHRKAIIAGGAVGVTMGAAAIGMLYLLTYVWPWSVLIGCKQ